MNAARAFMRREDYQPKQARNPAVCRGFNIACVQCDSASITIVGEFDEESGELVVSLYCPRCRVREPLKLR